ncbi:MAG: hypothetical protein U0792_11130 [Gemmataceae bacterium]
MQLPLTERRCGPDDIPQDLFYAFDEAEGSGACLVVVSDAIPHRPS